MIILTRYSVMLAVILTIIFSAPSLASPPLKNIVRNGDFESAANGRPTAWQTIFVPAEVSNATLSLGDGREGGNALKLEYPVQSSLAASADPLAAPPVGIEQQGIALNVSDPYTLSFWIRGEGLHGKRVRVAIRDDSEQEYIACEQTFYATPDWRQHRINFQWWLNKAPATATLRVTMEEYGTLWLDDVTLSCIPPALPRYNPQLPPTDGRNLLPNGSFELGRDGWTTLGSKTGWGGDLSGLFGTISGESPVEGAHCLKIELGPGHSPVTYYDCWPTARVVQNSLLAANWGWIDVIPGTEYTLSAYMKASRPGVTGRLMIRQGGNPMKEGIQPLTKDVTLSQSWERHALTIKAQSPQMCIAAGPDVAATSDTKATVWIDAIQLEAGTKPTAPAQRETLELGINVAPDGHVFTPQEIPTLDVRASNAGPEAAKLILKANIRNYFGRIMAIRQLSLDVPAGSTSQHAWSLGQLGRGYFTATVEWTAGTVKARREIRLAVLEPYPWIDSPFGVNHAPVAENQCRMMHRAGILWARDWSLNWGQLEPEPGRLSFEASDIQLDRLKKAGFQILCLMPPFPATDWISSAPDTVSPDLWVRMGYMTKDREKLFTFMSQAIKHSRDRVRVWEFLNEPIWTGTCLSQSDFNKPGDSYTPADYAGLLKQAYHVIKKADPQGRVIGGFSAQPWHYTREFAALGGFDSLDIFNIHNYGTLRAPEAFISEMQDLLKLMEEHGGRKPIWLTEYSYYGTDQPPWEPWVSRSDGWANNLLLRDERQCADWTVRYNIIMMAHGVDKIFYHSGMTGEPNNGVSYLECALFAEDGQPRKLYTAQATLAGLFGPEFQFVRSLPLAETIDGRSTKGIYGYAFQCGKRSVMPIWTTESVAKGKPWYLVIPKDSQALDLMGNPLQGEMCPLEVSPIYLVSTSLPADRLAASCSVTTVGVSH